MTNFERVVGFKMRQRCYSQIRLAKQLNVAPATVHNWLTGKSHPTPDKCTAVANLLGIDPDAVIKASEQDVGKNHGSVRSVAEEVIEEISTQSPEEFVKGTCFEKYTASEPTAEPIQEPKTQIVENTIIKSRALQTIRMRTIAEMQGCACVYKVDTGNSYIELSDENGGTLTGMIEFDKIEDFIAELRELLSVKGA